MKEYRTIKGGEEALRLKNEGIEASFHILSQGSWPIRQEVKNAVMPSMIKSMEDEFKSYYTKRYQGKALEFCP